MFLKKGFRYSSILAVVAVLVLLQIGKGSATVSKLNGKYIYDSDPFDKQIHKVLLLYGFEVEDLSVIHHFATETTKQILVEGDKVKVTHVTPKGKYPQEYIDGNEVDEPYLLDKPEYVAKTTLTLEADKDRLTLKRKLVKKSKELMTEVLKCREDGCTGVLSAGTEKVTIQWKRVN